MIRRLLRALTVLVAATLPPSAEAGQDPRLAVVEALDNLALGTWAGFGDLRAVSDHRVCVGPGEQVGAPYAVSVQGDGPGGELALTGSGGHRLRYRVRYGSTGGSLSELEPGDSLGGQPATASANALPDPKCVGANRDRESRRLEILIPAEELGRAPAGAYAGMLTLRVTLPGGGNEADGARTVALSAFVANVVRISQLRDIFLGTWNGAGPLEGASGACIFSNVGGYAVTALGDGADGRFSLVGPGGARLPYAVEWSDRVGATTGTRLDPGRAAAGFRGGALGDLSCGGARNATVTVRAREEDLSAVPPGSYFGVLTLVIRPD